MNLWKLAAIASTSALIFAITSSSALADQASARPSVAGAQPNMAAALARLKEARAALDRAEHDKGGWRAAAIQATDAALKETERGIAFGAH
jgi:hypothetical protein